ncbi:MAG TPA: hypothetical protein VLE53_04765 [Gemmatimonadaceae bacterium]|nr:hypothetical protein [Gemmatimonadaceae bacterium]
MTQSGTPGTDATWALVEREKRRDRALRRVSVGAWSITFILLLLLAVAVGMQVSQMLQAVSAGVIPLTAVFWSAMPLISVLGILSVLIGTLSTVGIFLRLRTASLTEIQLRLAALEEMLATRGDARA